MDIIKWFFFVGLGVMMGSFGVVQLLILIFYSLPTNRALTEGGYTRDFNKMMKSDKMSIMAIGLITLVVSILVYSFASSSNWAIYVWTNFAVVIMGRKQLKGNDNNITDYVKSHQRFLVDINELDDERMNLFISILQGQKVKYKSGLGGFLLFYAGAIAYYTYRAVYSIFESMELLSSPEAIGYLIQIDSKTIPFVILQIIITIGIVTFGIFVLYSIINKKKTIKAIVKSYHISLMMVSIATLIMASFIPYTLENENIYLYVIEVVITILFAAWGIKYFNVSKRVANTFFDRNNFKIGKDSRNEMEHSDIIEHMMENQKVQELTEEEKKRRLEKEKRVTRYVSGFLGVFLVIILTIWYGVNNTSFGKYLNANALYQMGRYDDAIIIYDQLGDYKNAEQNARIVKYKVGINEYFNGDIIKANSLLESIKGYKDSSSYLNEMEPIVRHSRYNLEGRFFSNGKYFEYNKDGMNEKINSNIPAFSGESFRFIDYRTIIQFGDGNNWSNSYGLSFLGDDILIVHSFKNGVNYKLNRK